MVKLMGKKSKALASPHSLEEWTHASTGKAMLLTPHHAASRIQLRYRVYKDKVRALLKKGASDAKDEGPTPASEGVTSNVSSSVKAAIRERGVKGSSMALAVAYKARKDQKQADGMEAVVPSFSMKNSTAGKALHTAVHPDTAGASSWTAKEWTAPSNRFHPVASPPEEEDEEESYSEQKKAVTTEEVAREESAVAVVSDDSEWPQDRKFVNVMHPSWLLSTMEERCADAVAALGARGPRLHDRRHQLTVLDIRHTVLDLLFILRSGVTTNLSGRSPASTTEHRSNLVKRLSAHEDNELRHRVHRIFEALKSDMVMPAVRCLGWLLTKTWRKLFHGLHVDVESLLRVQEVLAQAAASSREVSVVFTPTHKSHLDYLIISYLCFAYGIPLPRIAAGNNLDLPLIGRFLRANGSFFIRRSFKDDPLYKQVLQHYVHELLADGNPLEVFIEGGRSRHGRVCKPRMGFLAMFHDYVLGSVDAEGSAPTKDVLLVPISLDYDRVFEVEEYATQLLGKPKEKESLKVFFQSVWDLLFLHCGHCYVRFGEPVSISERPALTDTAQVLAERMQSSGTVTSTALLATVLMWSREYVTREMLVARVRWLAEELETRGATLAPMDDVEALVAHALTVLEVDVKPNGVVLSKVEFPTRALELGFYRNHVLSVLLPEMALLGAIDALRLRFSSSHGGRKSLQTSQVLETAALVWRFLRHICRHADVDLAARLEELVLRVPALQISGDSALLHVDESVWRRSRLVGVALSLHWSFVDSLWLAVLAALSLETSLHGRSSEREVVRLAQFLAKELFVQREVVHAEAFCSESLKQAFEFLEEHGVLRFAACATSGARQFVLQDIAKLQALHEEVNAMRRPTMALYRPDELRCQLHDDELVRLTDRASAAMKATSGLPRSRGSGVYAAWMAH
ncbi:hypothetical protein P43SY_007265 [Pythium insidiosum]|uniref:Phospholipid/glycerol acyltransferase domain-containing protein n=1 Tax=Pythium insidiosum TaxID=114742 RepID=A0AAD5Q780_PYTIN|nr:hypothetical protein P43SY_007265 [Pythium insidiosum]